MERGEAVQPCEGVASAGVPPAQRSGAGGHTRLPQLHGDAGGRPRSRTGPRAWVDEEYKALHGLRRGCSRLE